MSNDRPHQPTYPILETIADHAAGLVHRRSVELLRENAGHHFESDGFDMRTCEEAVEAVEAAGFEPLCWYTSPELVTAARDWYDDRIHRTDERDVDFPRTPMIAHVHPIQAPEDVIDASLYLIGNGSVVEPPILTPSTPILVPYPDGIAVVDC